MDNKITELKLYCPLKFNIEVDDDDGKYVYKVDSVNYIHYDDEINARINSELNFDEAVGKRGLAAYFNDEYLDKKVFSAIPRVETRNGDIYGVITVKSYGELNNVEMTGLIGNLIGSLSDGFGEVFEQQEIRLGADTVYISFWNCSGKYFLKPESEVFPEQEINQGMGGLS